MPYLATMPSCTIYCRASPVGATIFDWSSLHQTVTNNNVINSAVVTPKFPPASMLFNGSTSHLTIPYSSYNVLGANNWIIHLVVNAAASQTNYPAVFSIGSESGDGGQASITIGLSLGSPNQWQVSIATASGSWFAQATIGNESASTWYDIIVTRIGGTVTAYLNGVPTVVTSSLGSTALYNAGGPVYIGSTAYSSLTWFNGNVDEVAVWNATAAGYVVPKISDLYNSSGAPALPQTRRLVV
jgi:hypothetical protein